jgi:Fe2+ transport system protein FeoA
MGLPPVEGDVIATLQDGERATITQIHGGHNLEARLKNMGLRPGKSIVKLGAMPGGGPVTVECDGFRVALGRGLACRVQVERQAPEAPIEEP